MSSINDQSVLGPKYTPKCCGHLGRIMEFTWRTHSTHVQTYSVACSSIVVRKNLRYGNIHTEPTRTPSDDEVYVIRVLLDPHTHRKYNFSCRMVTFM